ncbi:hypothetical protein DRE_06249 [Drechslerella stenobrocha 248]|uniref:Serine-rich protein n=1 Tax=Drechslerella stenobrocha 248 TaxID=1043628 RepID=W7I7Z5_9PEZI|nr:hypothetical protein DRE_06249 [Drechslerella stenobrocha 248]
MDRRRPLHQRSNSQINAGIKQADDVSSSLVSTQVLFHNLSTKRSQQHQRAESFEAGQAKYNDENEGVPSRGASVASKRTAKTSRSSSSEKRGGTLALQVVRGTSRSNSVKSSDARAASGLPPYTGPPQDTTTIRFVRRVPSASNALKIISKPSASALSSSKTTSEPADHTHSSSFYNLTSAEHGPSPDYLAQAAVSNATYFDFSLPDRKPSVSTSSSEPKTSTEVNISSIVQNFPPPPPIPETPLLRASANRSTIRLVPHSPLNATPVSSHRSRSGSRSSRSGSTGTRSRSSTSSSGGSRPRSRPGDIHRRPGSNNQVSRGSSKHSSNSYFSSISAIGLPPSRPLPTPPDRSPGSTFQEVVGAGHSTATLPRFPKSILKKARSDQEIGATSSIDAVQYPEIQPALSWILETPAPLKINKPKRARMQVAPDEAPRAIHSSNGAKTNGLGRVNTNSTAFSEGATSFGTTPSVTALNVLNVRGYSPQVLQTEGPRSQRATVFSQAESSSSNGIIRHPSVLNKQSVPEWARVYYGRGAPLPNYQEDDDLAITPVIQRPRPAHLHLNTDTSQAGLAWMGTLNPEGQDLRDQFHQPRLENYPIDRSERINIHLVLACVGFVFPVAWFVGAFYRLPPQTRRERRERQEIRRAVSGASIPPSQSSHVRGPSITHLDDDSFDTESLPSFTTFEEGRRWDNARWWRNLSRVMSVVGLLVLGAVIALLVVGLKAR